MRVVASFNLTAMRVAPWKRVRGDSDASALTALTVRLQYPNEHNTIVNWVASVWLLTLICFSIGANMFYAIKYHNVANAQSRDVYAGDKEWLFGSDQTGVLNASLVYTFIASDNSADVARLKTAFFSPAAPFDEDTPCIAYVGQDAGSSYALCDHLDIHQLPEWAHSFDALLVQTIYLSTAQQFSRGQKATPFVGVMQGFKNERATGWFEQETLERLYCTTKQMAAPSTEFHERIMYTKAHGVLRSVDCSAATEQENEACRAIDGQAAPVPLFSDQVGNLLPYEVVRQEDGSSLVMSPFTTIDRIGQRTTSRSLWPIDDCLYIRGDSIGWFGVGLVDYRLSIPVLALFAKMELVLLVFVVWFITFQRLPYRVHHALFETSRLGAFWFHLAFILYAVYSEQDLMRTIFSWERHSVNDWLLFLYVLSSISLATTLLALLIVRFMVRRSMFTIGCWLSAALPLPVVIVELAIARIFYPSYTVENGLMVVGSLDCGPGFDDCGVGNHNYLHLVSLLTPLPALIQTALHYHYRHNVLRAVVAHEDDECVLTSFERICLDEQPATALLTDLAVRQIIIAGVPHTSGDIILSCGYTVIKDRFLIRTKDVLWLVSAAVFPCWVLRDTSLIVWPLVISKNNGTLAVGLGRRVLLKLLPLVHCDDDATASLLCLDGHPLA